MVPTVLISAAFNTEFIYIHLCVISVYNTEAQQIGMKILSNPGYLNFFRVLMW